MEFLRSEAFISYWKRVGYANSICSLFIYGDNAVVIIGHHCEQDLDVHSYHTAVRCICELGRIYRYKYVFT